MPITKNTDPSTDLTTFTCEGLITFAAISDAMKCLYDGTDGPPTAMVLWDLSMASTENLSFDELDDIAELRLDNVIQMTNGKTAIVASNDLDFGMVRMFQAKAAVMPRYLMVFRTVEKAMEWMGLD